MATNRIKNYSISLEIKLVERALKILDRAYLGCPLSPTINKMLKQWVEQEERILFEQK